MTVFNHFPRKEDMFFDREEEIQTMAFEGILGNVGPVFRPSKRPANWRMTLLGETMNS